MIVENKYVLIIDDLGKHIIYDFVKSARIETPHEIIIESELNKFNINLFPILEDIKYAELNRIYNYKGQIICEQTLNKNYEKFRLD